MRTLLFNVNRQNIVKNPYCDFTGLVPGTEGYLKAEFNFSSEWNGFAKVATFWTTSGKELQPQALEKDNSCIIPKEALKRKRFLVQIIGKCGDMKLVTDKEIVEQDGARL